ncbi:MAG: SgcJ/EcaC family oxidoreductase [Thermoactinospora sp.]|nr:SgcJ/EcaC family oxidoreductase [Thermoactinospora sp.]
MISAETAVRDLFAAMEDAWNRGDADAFAACFTADATYTTFMGTVYRGRADVAEGHRALFAKALKGTTMFNELTGLRFVAPDVAVVTGRGDVGRRRPRELPKVQTYTLVREGDGEWRVAAFHNTRRKPLMEALTARLAPGSAPRA